MLKLNAKTGALDFKGFDCAIRGWNLSVEANGEKLISPDADIAVLNESPLSFCLTFPKIGLAWAVACQWDESRGSLVIDSTLENRGDKDITLGKASLLETTQGLHLGRTAKQTVSLSYDGTLTERHVRKLSDPDCLRLSKIKTQFYNRADRKAAQVGFITFKRANTTVEHEADANGAVSRLRAACDFAGWRLKPGTATPTETFRLAAGDCPFAQLESWADLAAERCEPRDWEDAAIGWTGHSWVDVFSVENTEEAMLRNAAAIRRRLDGFGIEYVWNSICNITDFAVGDWLNWNYERFPHGPHYLAAGLRGFGLKWAMWIGPFWMCSVLKDKLEEFHDAILKDPDGSYKVVHPKWHYAAYGKPVGEKPPVNYGLDPSHPKTINHVKKALEVFRAWGVRWYMWDFLHTAAGNIAEIPYFDHYDKSLVSGPETYHHALKIWRDVIGDDTYVLTAVGPPLHQAGIAEATRTGADFGEGRPITPGCGEYPATSVFNTISHAHGPRWAIRNQAAFYYAHRKLFICESGNVLTVDSPIPVEYARMHATIHAMSGGGSMIGDDIDRMDEDRLDLIKKTLPRSKAVAFPVDLFDAVGEDMPKMFLRRIAKPWGSFDVLAVYNCTEDLLRLPLELARLGLKPDADYLVWEFWNCRYLRRTRGTFEAVVPPESVRVFRFVEDLGVPVLLGTDMHIMMGEMEIDECRWDANSRTLSGRALRPAGERGNVFFHAPANVRLANPRGLWIAKDALDKSLVIKASLLFEASSVDWSVSFTDLEAPIVEHKPDWE